MVCLYIYYNSLLSHKKRIMFLHPKPSLLHLLQSREEKQSASNYTHKILIKEKENRIRKQSTAYRAQLIMIKSKSIPGAESLSHSATVKTVAQHLSKLQSQPLQDTPLTWWVLEIHHPNLPRRGGGGVIWLTMSSSHSLDSPQKMPCFPGLLPTTEHRSSRIEDPFTFIPSRREIPWMGNFSTIWSFLWTVLQATTLPTCSSFHPLSFPSLFLFPLLHLHQHFKKNSNLLHSILAPASQRTQDLDYPNSLLPCLLASRPFICSLTAPQPRQKNNNS